MNIWKNSQFTRYFASFSFSSFGDWFDIFALQVIFVHEWNASPILLGILLLFYFLPSVILGPMTGTMADRVSQRNLMLYTDILSGIFTAGLFFSGSSTQALVLLFLRSCTISFNIPAQQAYVKHVVSDEHLLKATSYITIMFQMCKVLGPMVGAAVLIHAPARWCLAINTISFLISAVILFGLPRGEIEKTEIKNNHWVKDMVSGAQYIWDTRVLRMTIILVSVWFFCSLVRQAQLALFLAHLLPEQENALGIFMGLDGLGAVTTSVILSRKTHVQKHGFYFFCGFLLLSIGILGVALYQSNWPQYFLYFSAIIIGSGTGILLVIYSYIVKKETPMNKIGCVSGITGALQNLALTMGTFSSGFLILGFGIRKVYCGLAIVMLILGICSVTFFRQKKIKDNPKYFKKNI